ncbi:MAG: hydroxyethylthiazole kinase [Proteobacteria bacterium]|nr:hydroxyethylthiazole kinase [Pseudomonadota bacterium]
MTEPALPHPDNVADAARQNLAERIAANLARLRAEHPRIHAITGPIAYTITANGLIALGANPTLTANMEECAAFIHASSALLLNFGMMDKERFAVIPHAADIAAKAGKPFVLDPAFADTSPARHALARQVLAHAPFIMKPNRQEAEAFSCFVPESTALLVTGAQDHVRLGTREAKLANGHPYLGMMTATGCLLGAILAAMASVESDPFHAAISGVSILNIAAEIAAAEAQGPGTFAVRLIDALAALDEHTIEARLNVIHLHERGE